MLQGGDVERKRCCREGIWQVGDVAVKVLGGNVTKSDITKMESHIIIFLFCM